MDAMLISIALIVIVGVYMLLNGIHGRQKYNLPPCPPAIPLLGHAREYFTGDYMTLTELSKSLGGIFSLRFAHLNGIVLNDWKLMKEALIIQSDIFSDKPLSKRTTGHLHHTFLNSYGAAWKEKRRFTIHHLRNLGFGKSLMENTILGEITKIFEILDKHNGKSFKFNEFFFSPVLNVLWGVIAGKTYNYEDEKIKYFCEMVKANFASARRSMPAFFSPILRYLPGDLFDYHKLMRRSNEVFGIIEKEIDEHMITMNFNCEPRDYIDVYLREIIKWDGKKGNNGEECYQKTQLIGGIYDFFQAGMETTGTTLEWGFLYMAIWRDIQEKVQKELDTIIGSNRMPFYTDYPELPYTRATIMEIQRFSTVIPICSPRSTNADTTIGGYTIPKGTNVVQNCYAVHFDKNYWGDPEVFRPERFINEKNKVEKPENWIPFSTGPRVCLGEPLARMEVFLFFACLMQRYSFHCVTGEPLPSLDPVKTLTLQPKQFKLVIKQRKPN